MTQRPAITFDLKYYLKRKPLLSCCSPKPDLVSEKSLNLIEVIICLGMFGMHIQPASINLCFMENVQTSGEMKRQIIHKNKKEYD